MSDALKNKLRNQFADFRVDPAPEEWQRMESSLKAKRFFRFSWKSFNIYYLALVLLGLAGGLYLALSSDSATQEVIPAPKQENTNTINTTPIDTVKLSPKAPMPVSPVSPTTPGVRMQRFIAPIPMAKDSVVPLTERYKLYPSDTANTAVAKASDSLGLPTTQQGSPATNTHTPVTPKKEIKIFQGTKRNVKMD